MPKNGTHILPVGFDVDRLVVPFLRNDYTPDRIILVRTPSDPSLSALRESRSSRSSGKSSTSDVEPSEPNLIRELLQSLLDELDRTFDGPIEERVVDSFHDYEIAYEAFHNLLPELAGDGGSVHINISPLPKAAAIAVNNAVAALQEETQQSKSETGESSRDQPSLAQRLNTYYIPAKKYRATRVFEELHWMQNEMNEILKAAREGYFDRSYLPSRPKIPVYEALTDPLIEQVEGIAASYTDLVSEIEGNGNDPDVKNQIRRGYDFLEEVREPLTWHKDVENLTPLDPDATELPSYLDRFDDEYELPLFMLNRQPSEPLARFASQIQSFSGIKGVDDSRIDTLEKEIAALEFDIERFEKIADWFETLQQSWEWTGDVVGTADRLLDDISNSGFATDCGTIQSLSPPPVQSLRPVEMIVIATLHTSEETPFKSAAALSERLAESLTESLNSWLISKGGQSGVESKADQLESELMANFGRRAEREKLQSQMQSSLQSRLQYNLETLEEKGYISRETVEGRKRPSIGLSQQGRLKAATLDDDEYQKAAKEIVLKEIEKFQDKQDGV